MREGRDKGDGTEIGGALRMQWILPNSHDLCEISESFMVDRLNLRLEGNTLKVEAEHEENDALVSAAHTLAERYIAVLRKYIPAPIGPLMTVDESTFVPAEFTPVPVWVSMVVAQRKRPWEHALFRHGLRKARHEMLASSDPYLRRCYDYLEDAREDENNYLFHLYKFVEKFKEALSAEAKQALSAEARMSGKRKQKKLVEKLLEKYLENLKVKELVDDLETLCNHESLDARHAPKVDSEVKPLSAEDRTQAMSWADEILAAYERHIRSKASSSGTPL
jgi:hypothetical protein